MHFSLLFVSIVAALSFHESVGSEYGDCTRLTAITEGCGSHLSYIGAQAEVDALKTVADLDDPITLLNLNLDLVCNETGHLKMYVNCVFINVTTCLQEANSTQVANVPDASLISMGIVKMCDEREEINKTCVMDKKADMEACVQKDHTDTSTEAEKCSPYEKLYACTEELAMCDGVDVIKDFINSARPSDCETSAASQSLSAISMLLLTLMFSLLITL